jgi:hypothetical protein
MIIKHPHEKINQTNTARMLQKNAKNDVVVPESDLYNQRIDIDPYICD